MKVDSSFCGLEAAERAVNTDNLSQTMVNDVRANSDTIYTSIIVFLFSDEECESKLQKHVRQLQYSRLQSLSSTSSTFNDSYLFVSNTAFPFPLKFTNLQGFQGPVGATTNAADEPK